VVAALACGALAVVLVPFPADRLERYPACLILTDRGGQPLRVRLGEGDVDCRPTYRPDPDDWIVKAIVAAEDQRFWSHRGVDPLAMGRAIGQNLLAFRRVSGASTLSTQVIRLIEPRRRNLWSKAVEAFRALQLERARDKQAILAQYLNRAPFGSNIVGIEAAARRYFGKGADDLSLAEASLLAGLPQSPSRLRPDRHPERARKRQRYVLERMRECRYITALQQRDALAQAVDVRPTPYPFDAPHFCDLVLASGNASPRAGARTTLDGRWQRLAEEAARRHAGHLTQAGIRGSAIVILEVHSGAVRALVGSPDYGARDAGQVNAALAPRSAGSTLKPFAYALALDRGLLGPKSVLADVPTLYPDCEPLNFEPTFRGLVTLRDALVLSLNMPALDVERRVGQPVLHDTLRALGLSTLSQPAAHYGLGLVLGNGEVRLLDLANAYACLARGGVHTPARVLEDEAPAQQPRPVFSAEACWLITDMLSGDERAMDITGHAADARLPRMAWKTGTSSGLRDAWTIAYNPEYVIGVWVGDPGGASFDDLVGRKVATPIVWDIFRQLYPGNESPWFTRPTGVRFREVCAVSGCPPGPNCRERVEDWCIAGVTRYEPCAVHARPGEERWPARVAACLGRQQAPDGQTENGRRKTEDGRRKASVEGPRIRSPARGSSYRMMAGLEPHAQSVPLDAAGAGAGEKLFWFVNDHFLGESRSGEPLFWPLRQGAIQIVCSDARGHSDGVAIVVE
jgi:penicillin-binding protein 1C